MRYKNKYLVMLICVAVLFFVFVGGVSAGNEYNVAKWTNPINALNSTNPAYQTVLFDNATATYHMWYIPTGGVVFYTSSTDPANFTRGTAVTGLVTGRQTSAFVMKEGNIYYMINYGDTTENVSSIFTSDNGINWTAKGKIYNGTGLSNWIKIDRPNLLKETDGTYKMYFQVKSGETLNPYSTYLATTNQTTLDSIADGDNDTDFTLVGTTPVLSHGIASEWDGLRAMQPMVVKDGSNYYMWYTGYNSNSSNVSKIGFAFSSDGINWTKNPGNPILAGVNNTFVWTPSVLKINNTYHMWNQWDGTTTGSKTPKTIQYISANAPILSNIPDTNGSATVTNSTPQVVITNLTQNVTITIEDGVVNATIDVSSFITAGNGTIPQITINSTIANVVIPAGNITCANSSWNGVIAAPTITNVTVPDTATETMTTSTAIEIGFADAQLSFDNAVRILFPGETGKRVGYIRPGITLTEIIAVCEGDNQTIGDALAGIDGNCKINVGDDLVVWTKHFTTFTIFSSVVVSAPVSSIGGGGGSGGGSGCVSGYILENGKCIKIEVKNQTQSSLQLFDIKLELDSATINNANELVSVIRFASFGNVPTPVDLIYSISDSSGKEVYSEKGSVTVTTEQIVRKSFESLDLPAGKYTLVLTTVYGNNVKDEFRQVFEITGTKKGITGNVIDFVSGSGKWYGIGIIIALFIFIIAVSYNIYAKKKYLKHKY